LPDSMVVHILTNLPMIPDALHGACVHGIGTTAITLTSCQIGIAPRTRRRTARTIPFGRNIGAIAGGTSWGTDSEARLNSFRMARPPHRRFFLR
jgi:hypothetical protein